MHTPKEVLDALVATEDYRAVFYNEIISHRLHLLKDWLEEQGHTAQVTSQVSFKRAAVLAGLGHVGKNTLVANPRYGSNIRLGVLLTENKLPADEPNDPFEAELCTGCRRCISVCPQEALEKYRLDFSRCLITAEDEITRLRAKKIQKRGNFSVECNLCQKACPLNDG